MITADTNVFVYLHDEADPEKRAVARQVVEHLIARDTSIALQVVGEVQNVLRRKLKTPPWLAAQEARNLLESFDTFLASREASALALAEAAVGRLSYWDALLVASAREAGCAVLLSEDMADGAQVLGVRVINPFGRGGLLSDAAREALGL